MATLAVEVDPQVAQGRENGIGNKTNGFTAQSSEREPLLATSSTEELPIFSNNGEDSGETIALSTKEKEQLTKVPDSIPRIAYLIIVIELFQSISVLGVVSPLQNFISRSYNDPSGLPGGLGLGQASATALTNFYALWTFGTPMFGAVLADQWVGKYTLALWCSVIWIVGVAAMLLSTIPAILVKGWSLPLLVFALIVLGISQGGQLPTMKPLVADQYRNTKQRLRRRRNGALVLVDPGATIERICEKYIPRTSLKEKH